MDLGYRQSREKPPVEIDGTLLHESARSMQFKFEGYSTTNWLPTSQIEFHPDCEMDGKPHGRVVIPAWLARKEGIEV